MTYDEWKTTDPNDAFLGPMGIVEALELWHDGEMSLDALGDVLMDNGLSPAEVRHFLSTETRYPIPVDYFGDE